ncbi:MAG: hypothetical protein HYZ68_02180, partial [Chloroflexi bacterium]|nr:hypothetical protein [Chloroflexota bacterium]
GWEPKIDGWRMQIIRYPDGQVELWGRRLERKPNWTEKLPMIVKAAQKVLPPGTLLDAELSTSRGRRFIPSLFATKRRIVPIVFIFDVIYLDSRFVGRRSLRERKALLKKIRWPAPFQPVEARPVRSLEAHLRQALRHGHEGILLKAFSSPYLLARDGPMATQHWRKVKASR